MLVSSRAWFCLVCFGLNVIDEDLFHLSSAVTETVGLILLHGLVSKGVVELILAGSWQLTTLVWTRVILESLSGVVERSTTT